MWPGQGAEGEGHVGAGNDAGIEPFGAADGEHDVLRLIPQLGEQARELRAGQGFTALIQRNEMIK
jgi:hypothetical protein